MHDFLHQQHLATPTEDDREEGSAAQLYSQEAISLDALSNTKSANNGKNKFKNQNRSKTMDKFNTIHFQKVPSAFRKTSNFAEAAKRKIDMRTIARAPTHDIKFEQEYQLARQQDQKPHKGLPNSKTSNQIRNDIPTSKDNHDTIDVQTRASVR